jgi:hypothetical protein
MQRELAQSVNPPPCLSLARAQRPLFATHDRVAALSKNLQESRLAERVAWVDAGFSQ